METYYYLYRITNLINGKIYVGVHKTNNLDDGYMGSGKVLSQAIEKYGIEQFHKEIVQFYDSAEEMFNAEAVVVNEDFVNDPNTYNLKLGGEGGWDGALRAIRSDPILFEKYLQTISDELKKRWEKDGHNWIGRKHSEETKEKMRKSHAGKHFGKNNSVYGKCWIHHIDLKKSKMVSKDMLNEYLASGWHKGRKLNFQGLGE